MVTQWNQFAIVLWLAMLLSSCIYPLTMHSREGEKLDGRWRFGEGGGGLLQVFASDGEVLIGTLEPVARRIFFDSYEKMFGLGSIDADGPDLSAYGNGLWGPLGSSNALLDTVYGESFDPAAGQSQRTVTGPLFYWIGNLQGDKQTLMQCFMIGSRIARGVWVVAKAPPAKSIRWSSKPVTGWLRSCPRRLRRRQFYSTRRNEPGN